MMHIDQIESTTRTYSAKDIENYALQAGLIQMLSRPYQSRFWRLKYHIFWA